MRALTITFKSLIAVIAIVLLTLAICLQLARTALFFIDDYKHHVESFLSERLSADVTLGSIRGNWHGLRPTIEVDDLKAISRIDASTVEASNAFVVLDLSDTFLQLAPVFKHVRFADLTLTLSQNEQGAWGAAGFFSSNDQSVGTWQYRSPADLFSTVQFAELSNTQLKLNFFDGRSLDTVFPYTDITNDGSNHFLNISAAIDGNEEVFSIQVEGKGRPSSPDDFKAKALVSLNQFPAERLSRLLFLDKTVDTNELDSATLDGKFWFDFNTTRQIVMSGNFAFSGNQQKFDPSKAQAQNSEAIGIDNFVDIYQVPLKATITAEYEFNETLSLGLQNIQIDESISLKPIALTFIDETLEIKTESIALEPIYKWLTTRFAPSIVTDVVGGLSPRGELKHLQLTGEVAKPKNLVLQAYADSVAVDSYFGVPQFEQVSGYVESTIEQGSLQLDATGFSMATRPFYQKPFTTRTATGEISWLVSPADNRINVQGKHLSGVADFGRLNGFFDLELPWETNASDIHLNLQIGLEDSEAKYTELFLPTILSSDLSDWIKTAVKEGDIASAGVIYRGGFKQDSDRAIQLYLDIDNGQLAYQPGWPMLEDVSTELIFDDNNLSARVSNASIDDGNMSGVVSWNEKSKQRLSVQADIQSSAQSALRFVENSPLKEQVGDTFSDWQVEGGVAIELDLLFGLGEGDNFSSQLAEINLSDNRLYLPQQNLAINNAKGAIFYSSENGFSSSELNGLLFDEPTLLEIDTQDNGDLLLSGTGGIDVNDLSQWLDQPLLSKVSEGLASYTFDFLIPRGVQSEFGLSTGIDAVSTTAQTLSIYSDLKNIRLDLPTPFGKSLSDSKDFVLEAEFNGGDSTYTIQLDNTLYADLNFSSEEDFTSIVQLSDQPFIHSQKSLPAEAKDNPQGLFVFGDFSSLDIEPWLPIFKAMQASNDDSVDGFPVFYDVKTELLTLINSQATNVSVLGYNNSDTWENVVASDNFAGNVFYRADDVVPLTINLDYLLLAKINDENETGDDLLGEFIDPLADVEFVDIPSAAVEIKYLEYDEKPLGVWSFEIDAQPELILVENIQGAVADIAFTGLMQGEGASLGWSKLNGQNQTTISARIKGGDLESLFELWGLPPSLNNEQLHAAIDLTWAGSPAAIRVAALDGDIDFLLENGSFVQASGNATGFLQILSFLNFDTWIKRLRLNFSGMLDEGVAFDNVSGRLNFNQGIVRLEEPVEVNGDSVAISLSGFIDYPRDNIEGNLAVVLPVGGNLNLAAAIAGGLPAAVAVYLVRQVFKDEFDKASTVNYQLSGSLDNPEINFINNRAQ